MYIDNQFFIILSKSDFEPLIHYSVYNRRKRALSSFFNQIRKKLVQSLDQLKSHFILDNSFLLMSSSFSPINSCQTFQ